MAVALKYCCKSRTCISLSLYCVYLDNLRAIANVLCSELYTEHVHECGLVGSVEFLIQTLVSIMTFVDIIWTRVKILMANNCAAYS